MTPLETALWSFALVMSFMSLWIVRRVKARQRFTRDQTLLASTLKGRK